MKRLIFAAVLLLAACGAGDESTTDIARSDAAAMNGGGGPGGGGGGGGGMGGGMAMDPLCMGMGGGGMGGGMGGGGMAGQNRQVMLGMMLFCDMNLSEPKGQSCAACHAPSVGFTGPTSTVNAAGAVYQGANPGWFGDRKPPSAAYATPSPTLQYDEAEELFFGGLFWDGRATGWTLGDPAAEQAMGPFLNPAEQNLPDATELVRRVCAASYGNAFRAEFGASACDLSSAGTVAAAYANIGRAISAFEASPMVNRYSSKYDRYLRGEVKLTALERRGLQLFKGKAQCALCHPADLDEQGNPPLFTDNTFDNLGLPKNPENPIYDAANINLNPGANPNYIDVGLGGFLAGTEFADLADLNKGKQRVPTLRNVDKRPSKGFVKAYGHNGYFKSLKAIIHFYNTRDVLQYCETANTLKLGQTCWPAPEYAENINREELGNLKLTEADEDALIAFLATLSDE